MLRAGWHAVLVAALCLPGAAAALQLDLPSTARQTAARDSALDRVDLPLGPYADGALDTRPVEGPVVRRSYRIPSPGLTPLQLLAPLRAQLQAAGYTAHLDCEAATCGGFDFRFAIEVLPAPNMYVNIRAYHFLSAQSPAGAVMVLTSTTQQAGYIQIIRVGEGPDPVTATAPLPAAPLRLEASTLTAQLVDTGAAVLNSLDFAVGTTTLTDAPVPEFEELAALMTQRPGLRIAVVGHTDTSGGLQTNITVSRARAQAVRQALIDGYGIAGDRVEAEGMGYLAPVASNLTAAGREANRRVEVILLSEDG